LVVDNVDDRNMFFEERLAQGKTLFEYIPRCGHGAVLFTSRNRDVAVDLAEPGEPITVTGLDPYEGLALVRKRLPSRYQTEQVTELLENLEYIPLAITQAVAYMIKRNKTIKQYLAQFDKSDETKTKLLSSEFSDHTRPNSTMDSVAKTWTLSFEWIRDNHKDATDLLCLMSFFQRQKIPVELLTEEDEDEDDFDDKVAILCSFSLVEADESTASFNMHRLVQLATRWWLDRESKTEADEWAKKALSIMSFHFPESTHHPDDTYWVLGTKFLPHAELLLSHDFKTSSKETDLSKAALLLSIGRYIIWKAAREDGLKHFLQSFELRSQHLGLKHEQTLKSMGHVVWEKSRRPENDNHTSEAVVMGEQLYSLRREVLGENHRDTIDALSDYATALGNMQDYAQSEQLQGEALRRSIELMGDDHPDTLNCYVSFASVLFDSGNHAAAEETLRTAIPLQKRVLGEDHASVLISRHALALAMCHLDRQAESLPIYREVLAKQMLAFGLNHWETLMTLLDLCDALDYLGEGYEEMGSYAGAALAEIEKQQAREGSVGNDYAIETVLKRLRWYRKHSERKMKRLDDDDEEDSDDFPGCDDGWDMAEVSDADIIA
jgi:tetratricopeptide (TPR) repeat protein